METICPKFVEYHYLNIVMKCIFELGEPKLIIKPCYETLGLIYFGKLKEACEKSDEDFYLICMIMYMDECDDFIKRFIYSILLDYDTDDVINDCNMFMKESEGRDKDLLQDCINKFIYIKNFKEEMKVYLSS